MYKTLLGSAMLAGCLAVAQSQNPTQTPSQPQGQDRAQGQGRTQEKGQTPDHTSTQTPERSTAKTAGENNRAMNQANDKTFAMKAAMGGMAEVELGKLASEKATSPDVKQFAQRMVTDHGKANDELKTVASKESIDLPTSLDGKHQATV